MAFCLSFLETALSPKRGWGKNDGFVKKDPVRRLKSLWGKRLHCTFDHRSPKKKHLINVLTWFSKEFHSRSWKVWQKQFLSQDALFFSCWNAFPSFNDTKKVRLFFCCSRKRVAWDNSCFAKTKFIAQKILLCPLNLLSIAEIARVVNFLIYLQSSTRPFMRKARIWSKSISINAHDQNNRVKNEAIKFHRPWLDKCMHGSVQSSPIKHDISSRRWSCAPWRLLLDIFLGSPT